MPIVIACSACQGKIGVADEHLGKSIRCPKCNGVIKAVAPEPTTAAALVGPAKPPARTAAPATAPAKPRPAAAPTPAGETISVTCAGCKKKLQVKAGLAGKAIKCPGCAKILKVPVPTPAADDGDGWLDVNEAAAPEEAAAEPVAPKKKGAPPTGDWGKDLLDEQEVPDEMQDQLRGELTKSERILWAARPRVDIVLHQARMFQLIGGPIFGLVSVTGLGLTVFFIIKGITLGFIIAPIFGLLFGAGAVYAFLAPGIVQRNAPTRACYVITNRRFLRHPGTGTQMFFSSSGQGAAAVHNAGEQLSVTSWTGFELTRLVRTMHKKKQFEGAGELAFSRTLMEEPSGATMWAVEDVRAVEKMLREKLLHPLIDKLLRGEAMSKEEKAQAKKLGVGEGEGNVVAADSNIKEYGSSKRTPEFDEDDPNIKDAKDYRGDAAKKVKAYFERELKKVPAELRKEAEEELTEGEKILWIGKPEGSTKGRGFFGAIMGAAKRYEPDYYLYILTNRRIILFARKKGPLSYYSPNILEAGVEEDDRFPNGGGIIFRKVKRIITTTDKQGKTSTRVEMHYFGLLRIRDYKAVAALVYDTLIAPCRN